MLHGVVSSPLSSASTSLSLIVGQSLLGFSFLVSSSPSHWFDVPTYTTQRVVCPSHLCWWIRSYRRQLSPELRSALLIYLCLKTHIAIGFPPILLAQSTCNRRWQQQQQQKQQQTAQKKKSVRWNKTNSFSWKEAETKIYSHNAIECGEK